MTEDIQLATRQMAERLDPNLTQDVWHLIWAVTLSSLEKACAHAQTMEAVARELRADRDYLKEELRRVEREREVLEGRLRARDAA